MARFMKDNGKEVVESGARRAEIRTIENNISRAGAAQQIKGSSNSHDVRAQALGDPADIAKSRVSLDPTGDADRLAAVIDQGDANIRVGRPSFYGLQYRRFPNAGRRLGIERLEQIALSAANCSPVRDEADCRMLGIRPGHAPGGQQIPVF